MRAVNKDNGWLSDQENSRSVDNMITDDALLHLSKKSIMFGGKISAWMNKCVSTPDKKHAGLWTRFRTHNYFK